MQYFLVFCALFASALSNWDSSESFFRNVESNCDSNEFSCKNGNCIPKLQRCNGNNDCSDNSDEEECDIYFCTEPHHFLCRNKVCTSILFKCDGENDCGDNSDEEGCFEPVSTVAKKCNKDEWMCSDQVCIARELVCNGEHDCLDGSDESKGCTPDNCKDFLCKNGHCIPHGWRCDDFDDCHDNSDEVDCDLVHISPEQCIIETGHFLCANNQTCIKADHVCDNTNNCPDGSDEGQQCLSTTNTCNTQNCSHSCIQLPSGPVCTCQPGYHTLDGKNCIDFDECQLYGICDQRCRNSIGSYECYCDSRYILQPDKKSCKYNGEEAAMYFSTKNEIRAYFLNSNRYELVAGNLKQAIGIASDGSHMYWTDIRSGFESIYKASPNGKNKELILTSGLGAPEDLAVDWITGNIYFTDSQFSHIGVCTADGIHCTVLINKDIRKPRGIVLNPSDGMMYWSDWAKPAEIVIAKMDGTEDYTLVSKDIYWPNGLALDYPNKRLYWVDAKKKSVESINIDGTERYVIMEGTVRHPYAIAVFEDRLFWSDWRTHSIHSCDKFTGKNKTTVLRESKKEIYGIHIQHSAIKTKSFNPCMMSMCSHMCLLSGTSFRCACPPDTQLARNNETCSATEKPQKLLVGSKDVLLKLTHPKLGRHHIDMLPVVAKDIGPLTFDTVNNNLFLYDNYRNSIIKYDLELNVAEEIIGDDLKKVEDIAYDYYGNNLYWCDSVKSTVEVYNIATSSRKILIHDMDHETPKSIVVLPEEGIMFVAFQVKSETHIDRFTMDGKSRSHIIEKGLIGPIKMVYDHELNRVFWADETTGVIESTSTEGDDRHIFKDLDTNPVSIAFLKNVIIWSNKESKKLYWANKMNTGDTFETKRITLDVPYDTEKIQLAAITPYYVPSHPCQNNNGNCSHLCILSGTKSYECQCPLGMNLKADKVTCYKPKRCEVNEFYCDKTDMCIPHHYRCNGRQDCREGEDEHDCNMKLCAFDEFKCMNGDCISIEQLCDNHFDCRDGSDEKNCTNIDMKTKCSKNEHRCPEGICLKENYICDGKKDCSDGSDELNCKDSTCKPNQFRCKSGSCIPAAWECDQDFDCPDLSDEHVDCVQKTCSSNQFKCKTGACIDQIYKCDSIDDCGDFSDEINCKENANPCSPNEFPCSSKKSLCVPKSARCNGTAECPHEEDEIGCGECHSDEFECNNRKCIQKSWVCDKADDCGDNSDESEQLCSTTQNQTSIYHILNEPCDEGFRCKTGKCISLDQVCNGVSDCFDDSDEGGSCSTACTDHSLCDHKCVPTPSGPRCVCSKGYYLNGDGKTCNDINECTRDPPLCSQLCTNLPGNYRCDCFDGFILRADRQACKSLGSQMNLYYTKRNNIRTYSIINNSLSQVFNGRDMPPITGLEVSTKKSYIYFSVETTGTIHRFNTQSKEEQHVINVGLPQKIALDWISDNIYYVDASPRDVSIKACNLDKKRCVKVIGVDTQTHISAIAVDSVNKYIFYSITTWWIFNSPSSIIYRTKLDGTKKEEIVKQFKGYVTGITFDFNKKILYYVDHSRGQVFSLPYNSNITKVVGSQLTKPQGLSFYEDTLYMLITGGHMSKCTLYGYQRKCEEFQMNAYGAEHFVISQENRQPLNKNPCENNNCDGLCIPVDAGITCLCRSEQFVKENEKCPEVKEDDQIPIFNQHKATLVEANSGNGTTIFFAIFLPLMLIAMGAALFVYFKRKTSGQFSVSMRFTNPIYGVQSSSPSVNISMQPGRHEYSNPIDFGSEDMKKAANEILHKVNPLVKLDD